MSSLNGPRVRTVRRLGLNVYGLAKATKGMKKGAARSDKKLSNYGLQLLEKQRLRAYYGVPEVQLKKAFLKAKKSKDQTGHALIKLLETRLDAFVLRAGFAQSIRQARQMVVHGHIRVNAKKVDIPSYAVKVGDEITLRERSQKVELFKENFESSFLGVVPYIEKKEGLKATLTRLPERSEVPIEIQDSLVVEFYSRLI